MTTNPVTDHDNYLNLLMGAAMQEPNTDLRQGLKASAAGIQAAIHVLCSGNASLASLQELNNMWAYAARLLALHNEQRNSSVVGNNQQSPTA